MGSKRNKIETVDHVHGLLNQAVHDALMLFDRTHVRPLFAAESEGDGQVTGSSEEKAESTKLFFNSL